MVELFQPETLKTFVSLTPYLVGLFGMALTDRQRRAILNRDNKKCNLPAEHECGGRLEVHHVLPQGYLGLLDIDPDFSENVVTICRNSHVGTMDSIHPDIAEALQNYHTDPKAIERVMEQRAELMANQEIYWNPKWDRVLSATAVRNTQKAEEKGWVFPPNGHNGKKKGSGV